MIILFKLIHPFVATLIHIRVMHHNKHQHSKENEDPNDMGPHIDTLVVILKESGKDLFHSSLVNSIPGQNVFIVNIPFWVFINRAVASRLLNEFKLIFMVDREVLIFGAFIIVRIICLGFTVFR